MSEPPHGPMAYLTVDNGDAAIAYYTKVFGAECDMRVPSQDGRVMHANLKLLGGYLMLSDDIIDGGGGTRAPTRIGTTTVTLHVDVPDARPLWEKAIAAGGETVLPLVEQDWGALFGKFRDPFGHVWSISSAVPADST